MNGNSNGGVNLWTCALGRREARYKVTTATFCTAVSIVRIDLVTRARFLAFPARVKGAT